MAFVLFRRRRDVTFRLLKITFVNSEWQNYNISLWHYSLCFSMFKIFNNILEATSFEQPKKNSFRPWICIVFISTCLISTMAIYVIHSMLDKFLDSKINISLNSHHFVKNHPNLVSRESRILKLNQASD